MKLTIYVVIALFVFGFAYGSLQDNYYDGRSIFGASTTSTAVLIGNASCNTQFYSEYINSTCGLNFCNATACYSLEQLAETGGGAGSSYNSTYDLTSTRVNQALLTTSGPTFQNITVETINGTFEHGGGFDSTLIRLQHPTNINNYLQSFGESYFVLGANVYFDVSTETYATEHEATAHAAIRMQTEGGANIYNMLSDDNAADLAIKTHLSTGGFKVIQLGDNLDYINLDADNIGGEIETADNLLLSSGNQLNLNGTSLNINQADGILIRDTDTGTSVFSIGAGGNTNLWNGKYLYIYSAGNDKNVQILHDDTNAIIDTTSGNIVVNDDLVELQQHAFSVRRGTAQAIASGVDVQVQFATEDYDLHTEYSTSNYNFTAEVAGVYHFTCAVLFTNSAGWGDGELSSINIRVNNAAKLRGNIIEVQAAEDMYMSPQVSGDVYLNAGDYVNCWAYQNSGGSINLLADSTYNYFTGHRVI